MTDAEFDVLDELYFVQPYEHLQSELDLDESELKDTLIGLSEKGWIKCYTSMDEEVFDQDLDLENNYQRYLYLASKKGLMAHNGR